MKKIWTVAKHEFRVTVKRVWFLVATLALPLFTMALPWGMSFLAHRTVEESRQADKGKPVGLVDRSGELRAAPRRFPIERFEDEEKARAALKERVVATVLVVSSDYLETGRIQVITMKRPTVFDLAGPPLPDSLKEWLVENVLRDADPKRTLRAQDPFRAETVYLDPTGAVSAEDVNAAARRSIVALVFFILIFMSILTSSAYLLQGMAEEKENRVMEMVLSSVTPAQLMAGKLIGLGAAGLLQVLIWVAMGIGGLFAFSVSLLLEPALFLFCFVFFLLGYVLYGSLMLGFGALGTNSRESQQMASIWSFLGIFPAFVLPVLIDVPQGALARIFSFIPFTAPTTMMVRYAVDPKGTPFLDIGISIALLMAAAFFALMFSARLYRAGLLLYGKRPGVKEIWRWLWAAR